MARTPARRVRSLAALALSLAAITVLREAAFRRNDRRHPLADAGRAP